VNIHRRLNKLKETAPNVEQLINWDNESTQTIIQNYLKQIEEFSLFLDEGINFDKDASEDDKEIAKQSFYHKNPFDHLFAILKLHEDNENLNKLTQFLKKMEIDSKVSKNSNAYLDGLIREDAEKVIPIFNSLSLESMRKIFEDKSILSSYVLNIDNPKTAKVINGISEEAFFNLVNLLKEDVNNAEKHKGAINVLFGVALSNQYKDAIKNFDYNFTDSFIDLIKMLEKPHTKTELKANLFMVLMDNKLENLMTETIKEFLSKYGDDENFKVSNSARNELFNLFEQKKCYKNFFLLEDSIGKSNYTRHESPGLISYLINEGAYEDFMKIINSQNRKYLTYFPDGLSSNPEHSIEKTELYNLAVNSQKAKFNYLLKNMYTYENKTYQEYLKQTNQEKLTERHFEDVFNIIFKDELHSLEVALESQKEYSMLEAVKEFRDSYTKKENKKAIQPKTKKEDISFFMKLTLILSNLFSNKKPKEQKVVKSELTQQQEFIRDLNANSLALNDKLNFLTKKVKINSSMSALHKNEIVEDIKQIRSISLVIEAMIEKEYSVKHVEAFVAYKNLTNKYFVKAVETFIQANEEVKLQNLDRKEGIVEFAQEFKEQIHHIKTALNEVKDKIGVMRSNDLLDEMKTDKTLLKMKASA
jgi:hypothetical protein